MALVDCGARTVPSSDLRRTLGATKSISKRPLLSVALLFSVRCANVDGKAGK